MFNPATKPKNELNHFTLQFYRMDDEWSARTDEYWVKLRNGVLVRPVFKEAEDDTCETAFFYNNYQYCWDLDGASVTHSNYDMMELVCLKY